MPAPTFFTTPIGNAPMFVAFFAAIADIELDPVVLSIPKAEHKQPDYLAVAPSGQLPGLRDGDLCVWESTAIVRYLAAKHRTAAYPLHDAVALAPIDAAFSWLWFNPWNSERDVAIQTWLIEVIRGGEPDPDRVAEATGRFERHLEFIEATFFQQSPHAVVGEQWTVADAVLGTLLWHGGSAARIDLDELLLGRPRLRAYWAHMMGSPLYRTVFGPSDAAIARIRRIKAAPPPPAAAPPARA